MNSLSNRISRRLRKAYHSRKRSRSEKLNELQERIDEAIEDAKIATPMSELSHEAESQQRAAAEQASSQVELIVGPMDTASPLSEQLPRGNQDMPPTIDAESHAEEWPELPVRKDGGHVFVPEATVLPAEASNEERTIQDHEMGEYVYTTFAGEDETDYTTGLPRMVLASDGIKPDCVALLMNLDLSQKIQAAVRSQRVYDVMANCTAARDRADAQFERKLRVQIRQHERQVRKLSRNEDDENFEELATAEQELEKLKLLMQTTQARRQGHDARVRHAAKNLREYWTAVSAYLEDAFVATLLLELYAEEEPQSLIEELTVEGEYERLCRQMQENVQGEDVEFEFEPLHEYNPEITPAQLSPEEQAKRDLKQHFFAAERSVQEAHVAFESRGAAYLQAKQQNYALAEAATSEEFDIQWHIHERQLTRDLIDAETALLAARAAALEGGVQLREIDPNVPSLVPDDAQQEACDGYPEDLVQAYVSSISRPTIGAWLDGVPSEGVLSPSMVSPDGVKADEEWQAEDVGLSDSLSVVAQDPERSKIDQWRRTRGSL